MVTLCSDVFLKTIEPTMVMAQYMTKPTITAPAPSPICTRFTI